VGKAPPVRWRTTLQRAYGVRKQPAALKD